MKHGFPQRVAWLMFLPILLLAPPAADAQVWDGAVRGSWVRLGDAEPGDVSLVDGAAAVADIVVPEGAHSAVRQAARFLAGDIEALTGREPEIRPAARPGRASIRLVSLDAEDTTELPESVEVDRLRGAWEAYEIVTAEDGETVWLVGSDARGAAFAVYTLAERLGIDPLHHWTGYRPERHERLILKQTRHAVDPPTFRFRGLFHDDEDILPRPFEYSGYPLRIGDVPLRWYERFFETALRLRMNMVAPYTRVHRRFEVQKTASDWGLYYTSHHYDILLSNPFGFRRFGLAEERGVTGDWDWHANAENMIRYWRAGVEENGELDAIWPVGLRGTEDYPYPFPKGTSEEEQQRVFRDVIDAQRRVTREALPEDKEAIFHFTLYDEMLEKYLAGSFEMPDDVILIWCDDNDGRMRALPADRGGWKHGVYYHLAYYGPVAKQSMRTIPPARIADQFKKIVHAGATEFMLLNVSELREFVMGTRMIAEICWDAETALADTPVRPMPDEVLPHVPTAAKGPLPPDEPSASAERFMRWWSGEYFGDEAADQVAEVYGRYEELIGRWDRQWYAGDQAVGAINSLIKRFAGRSFTPPAAETRATLESLDRRYRETFDRIDALRPALSVSQARFFFEHVELPLLVTWRHTQAAILLIQALDAPDRDAAWAICEEAMVPLERLEVELLRAERPPFERWYAKTFIRHEETGLNLHRPYEALRVFLGSDGTERLGRPDWARRPEVQRFVPLLGHDPR